MTHSGFVKLKHKRSQFFLNSQFLSFKNYILWVLLLSAFSASAQQSSSGRIKQSTTELEYALDRVDSGNQINSNYKGFSTSKTCVDCILQSRVDLRYQACSDKNDYLESEISLIKSTDSHPLNQFLNTPRINNGIIKSECIQMGMVSRFGENSKSFRHCGYQSTSPGKAMHRPCISENYFQLLNNSFQNVSQCMKSFINPQSSEEDQKLDVRAVYAMINVESGFHVNAMSGTGAGGIGQFTQSAIDDVNKNQLSKIKEQLQSGSESCHSLSQTLLDQPMASSRAKSCERISLKNGNPAKNMIYTFGYLNTAKQVLDSTLFKNKNYLKKFAHLPEKEINKIKRALMVWSHNTGPMGTIAPVKALLNTVYSSKKIKDADEFVRNTQLAMRSSPASANSSPARIAETSRYFPDITNTLKTIEDNMGGGSCVN